MMLNMVTARFNSMRISNNPEHADVSAGAQQPLLSSFFSQHTHFASLHGLQVTHAQHAFSALHSQIVNLSFFFLWHQFLLSKNLIRGAPNAPVSAPHLYHMSGFSTSFSPSRTQLHTMMKANTTAWGSSSKNRTKVSWRKIKHLLDTLIRNQFTNYKDVQSKLLIR